MQPFFWLLIPIILFVLYRLRHTGTKLDLRILFRPSVLLPLLLVVATLVASRATVRVWRRPGSMSLVDALASDMSNMSPPLGRGPVVLAPVDRATVKDSVRYTGTAVGYIEQDVYPRVTGWITWMPFYAGDRVKKGQLLAKLDTREYQSRTDERRANRQMAEQMVGIARLEYQQGLAAAGQARAEVRGKEGALEEVRRMHSRAQGMLKESQSGVLEARSELRAMQADLIAARQEQAEAEAMHQSAQAMQPEADAMLSAMQADQSYWVKEIARMKVLLEKGAVSGEEFQREEAMAKGADAKVRQAEARLQSVKSDIRAARAKVARAEAMVESAGAKISQAQARLQGMEAKTEQSQAEIAALAGRVQMAEGDLEAARANVRAMQAMAEAGAGKVRQAQSGVQGAEAALTTASVVQGYTEIRSLVDGVVTQRLISSGVLVNPGQAILKVAQIDPIRVQANVPEADLIRVRVGSPITLRKPDGTSQATARISSITPAMDPVSRTGVVEALVPNGSRRILPGQFVRMEIGTGQAARALRVPTAALRWQSTPTSAVLSVGRTAYVWVAQAAADRESHTVQRVNVRLGASDGQYTQVLSGLQEGQQVVVRGHEYLRPGDAVVAVPWTSEGPESLPAGKPGAGGAHSGHGGHGGSKASPPAAPMKPSGGADHSGHGASSPGLPPAGLPSSSEHSGHGGH